jgi:lysophospholipase L1-like esterase
MGGLPADAILIAIGVNDTKRSKLTGHEISAWSNNLERLVSLAQGSAISVYLSTILPTESQKTPFGDYSDPNLVAYFNEQIRYTAEKMKVELIDSNSYFSKEVPDFTFDGVHPTATGTQRLADFWGTQVFPCT